MSDGGNGVWYPEGASSRVLLLGTAHYTSDELPSIPAVHANLTSLRLALTDPERGVLPARHCRVMGGKTDRKKLTPASMGEALTTAAREATDLLLVYYAGHGLLDETHALHLALPDSAPDPGMVGFSAVSALQIRETVGRARARARVLILDCCYSGRVLPAMATPANLIADQLARTGTYTLTSTSRNELSVAPLGERHTAFTQALLNALAGSRVPTLDEIYHATRDELTGRGLPPPQRRSVNAAGNLALARTPTRVAHAAPVPSRTAPQPPDAPSPAGPPPDTVVFGQPPSTTAEERRRAGWWSCSALTAIPLVAGGMWALDWVPVAITAGFLLLVFACLACYQWAHNPWLLSVDATGLNLFREPRGGPSEAAADHFSWADILYVGLLHKVEYDVADSTLTETNVVVVRLRPNAAHKPVQNSGGPLQRLGYYALGNLMELQADPVLLREAVRQFAPDGYRTNNELLDLDPRLSTKLPS